MLWWELRLGLSLLVLLWLARLWGLVDHVLELLTLHFVISRIKLPVDLARVDLRLHILSGNGEMEIRNLRIMVPTTTAVTRREDDASDDDDDDDGKVEQQEVVVLIKRIFITFYTIQSLMAFVFSGGTQLVVDNVCIDGMQVNVEIVNVSESGGEGEPKDLKKLLNIWLIANAINTGDFNARPGSPSSMLATRHQAVEEDEDEDLAETEQPPTWRESRSGSRSENPLSALVASLAISEKTSAVSVSPAVLSSSTYSLPTMSTLPTVTARIVHGSGSPSSSTTTTTTANTTGPATKATATATATATAVPSPFADPGALFAGLLSATRLAMSPPHPASPPRPPREGLDNGSLPSQPQAQPLAQTLPSLFQQLNDSAQEMIQQVQSGELQRRVEENLREMERQASEFKEEVLADGLLGATTRRVRGTILRARQSLDEEMGRSLPSSVAELHAKIVGPDDPSWSKDVLFHDRVWVGGCLLVLDVEIRLKGFFPPLFEQALEKHGGPLRVSRLVLEGVGRRNQQQSGSGASPSSSPSQPQAQPRAHAHAHDSEALQKPTIDDGWALPMLQRRFEVALVTAATKERILASFDDAARILL